MVYFHDNLRNYMQEGLLNKLNHPFDIVPMEEYYYDEEEEEEDEEDKMFDGCVIQEIEGVLYYCQRVEYDFADARARAAFEFNETFQRCISIYCPVDTGWLLRSCFGFCDPITLEITCWANTHYAEYVEFGTSYMSGQHYMQRAIEEAIRQAMPKLSGSMFDEMNNAIEKAANEAGSMWGTGMFGEGLLGFFIGLLMSLLILIIMSPIIILLTALADICTIGAEAVNLGRVEARLYGIGSTSSDDYATRDFF